MQHLRRQLLPATIPLVLLHHQVVTHLEQLLILVMPLRQILLGLKVIQLTQLQQVQLVELLAVRLQLQQL